MSRDPKPEPMLTPAKAAERARRERRLAEALRENLKRRKDQSRGRSPESEAPHRGDEEK